MVGILVGMLQVVTYLSSLNLAAEVEKFGRLENVLCADELHFISEKTINFEWSAKAVLIASSRELICACDEGILIESADKQGWIKLYESSADTKVNCPSLHDGTLYFVVTNKERLQHTVRCMKLDPKELGFGELQPQSELLFTVDFEEDRFLTGHWPSLSVLANICLLASGKILASFNLVDKTIKLREFQNKELLDAVLVSPDRCFFAMDYYEISMLSGDLMSCALKSVPTPWSYGLCRWTEQNLLLLTENWDDDNYHRVEIILLDYDGKSNHIEGNF